MSREVCKAKLLLEHSADLQESSFVGVYLGGRLGLRPRLPLLPGMSRAHPEIRSQSELHQSGPDFSVCCDCTTHTGQHRRKD